MNKEEAIDVLERELASLRGEAYADLVRRIGHGPIVVERSIATRSYQIEIDCVWDGPEGGNVRVIGSVDDGGWRAFAPVTRSFVKSADGNLSSE